MTTRELIETKHEGGIDIDVYALIPELLDLKQINHLYGLAPGTIKRERWLQKQIKEKKIKAGDASKINTSGFGFRYDPIIMYGKIYYRRKDVEHFIKTCMEQSPEELLKVAQMASRARIGRWPTENILKKYDVTLTEKRSLRESSQDDS